MRSGLCSYPRSKFTRRNASVFFSDIAISRNIYIVEHAISYQTANRRHTSVEKNGRASRRMEKFLANLPHLSVIGDFHSHTGWGDLKGVGNLSTQDIVDMDPGKSLHDHRRERQAPVESPGSTTATARCPAPSTIITSASAVIISMTIRARSAPISFVRTRSVSMPKKASRKFS